MEVSRVTERVTRLGLEARSPDTELESAPGCHLLYSLTLYPSPQPQESREGG